MRKSLALLFSLLFVSPCFADIYIPPGGTGGGPGTITIPQTVGGTAVSGGVACFTSTTVLNSSGLLAAGSLVTGGGAGACPTATVPGLNVLTTLQAAVNATGGVISPTPTRAGDIIYWNGTTWVTLAGNNSGTTFLSESAAGVPSWATSAASVTFTTSCPSTTQSGSTIAFTNGANVQSENSISYTVVAGDCGKVIEASGTSTLITMPTPIPSGFQLTVGNSNLSGGASATLSPGGADTFNGSAADITLLPGQFVGLFAGSGASPTNWDVAGVVSGPTGTDPGYVTSQWYLGVNFTGIQGGSGAALATGTAYCVPQKLMNPVSSGGTGTIGSLAIHIATAGTTTITEAVYGDAVVVGVHRPKTLLGYTAQAANTSVATLTGALNAGVSVSSELLWTCATQGDSTGKATNMNIGTNIPYMGNGNSNALFTNTGYDVTFPVTYGASAALTWPADASGLAYSESSNIAPAILFQFSSIP